ncbi:MAG TPA: fused MFS/spermidine synthase [Verrucomicrobiae bacterium]
MLRIATVALVFLGGFVVMVLEMIGVLYLAKDFGGSFYVWTSQIGMILTALALGYAIGGTLADRFQRTAFLAAPLTVAGIFTFFIPQITPPLINAIIQRHPPDQAIPMIWMKLDPAFGSAVIFFLPCFVLAILSPYMIRIIARQLDKVGRISGLIYAASTAGSIGGVFVSGYILIDYLTVTAIFRAMGVLILFLAAISLALDFWLGGNCKGAAMESKHPDAG